MRAKQYRGFTLLEVVVAFMLISLITVMVVFAVTSAYTMSAKLKELPNSYYGAQDEVERELDKLSAYVKEKFRIQNELLGIPTADMDPVMVQRLAELNILLTASYENESVTLFGKSVDVFKFAKTHTAPTGQNTTLHAGAVNFVSVNRPTPIIDKVEINAAGESVKGDLYFGIGATVNAAVSYNSKNYAYRHTELYQWYVCTGSFHAADYIDGSHYEDESQYSTVYTIYPSNFTLLPGATGASFTVDARCEGRLLVCVVTPLSVEGTMGASRVSNYLYVSALPRLTSGGYKMVIDPSLAPVHYTAEDVMDITQLESRYPGGAALTATGSGAPKLSLIGAPTDTALALSPDGAGNYSRYLRFSEGAAMRSSGLSPVAGDLVFAVVRDRDGTQPDFLRVGGTGYGLTTNLYSGSGAGDTGWRIVLMRLNNSGSDFELGNANVDVAELIVTDDIGTQSDAILGYLAAKYHISS